MNERMNYSTATVLAYSTVAVWASMDSIGLSRNWWPIEKGNHNWGYKSPDHTSAPSWIIFKNIFCETGLLFLLDYDDIWGNSWSMWPQLSLLTQKKATEHHLFFKWHTNNWVEHFIPSHQDKIDHKHSVVTRYILKNVMLNKKKQSFNLSVVLQKLT